MSLDTIDKALITQFSEEVHIEAQQLQSRLRPYVEIKKMSGDLWAYDTLGQVEARELTSRYNPVIFDDPNHGRRKMNRRQFTVALPIDAHDVAGMLLSPDAKYSKLVAAAMERVFDKVVLQAAHASVYTGRDFETLVSFATDGGLTVDATGGLTYEKLLEADKNFIDNEVDPTGMKKKLITITGDEHTALMGEIELISGDYSRQFAVEKGQIQHALGFNLIKYGDSVAHPLIQRNSGGTERELLCLAEGGICVGISQEINITIKDRPDLVNVKQVQATFSLGAVRTEGKLVQKIRVNV